MGVSPMMNGVSDSSCLLRWHPLHVVLLTPHSSVNYMDEANYSMDASYGGPIPRQDSDVAPGSYDQTSTLRMEAQILAKVTSLRQVATDRTSTIGMEA